MIRNNPVFLLFLLPLLLPAQQPSSRPSAGRGRVVVLGASLSAGFGNGLPLRKILEKAAGKKKVPILDTATSLFFLKPLAFGPFQVKKALAAKPSLVIGLDFLFWYLYGGVPERARLERLKKGLRLLERLGKTPLILGDIPDMHGASPDMLPPKAIPRKETIRKAGEAIRAWAEKHPMVRIFPLAEYTDLCKKKGWDLEPGPGERPFPPVHIDPSRLLQKDRLHPSRAGALLLGRLLCRKIRKWFPTFRKERPLAIPAGEILKELPTSREPRRAAPATNAAKKKHFEIPPPIFPSSAPAG